MPPPFGRVGVGVRAWVGTKKIRRHFMLADYCGKRGIRTPDTLLTYTRFPGVPLQPLEHLSSSLAEAETIFQRCGCKDTAFYLKKSKKAKLFCFSASRICLQIFLHSSSGRNMRIALRVVSRSISSSVLP